jgi:hypothetical protein
MNYLLNRMRKSHILIAFFMLLLVSCERKSDEKTMVSPSTIEPEAAMNPQLNEFALQVREKTEEMNAASGQKALELQTKLSVYIAEQTQTLMNQGISIMEIQEALQAAAGGVEQTYAPDADEFNEETDERLEPPVNVFTFFLPVEEAAITAFTGGNLDESGLMEHIRISADSTPLEMTEGLDLVLGDFGRNQALHNVITSGEIVAGSGGEAFVPEYLTIKEPDGYQYAVSNPAVFKSAAEVQSIAALLEPFDKKTFFRKADIKKLLKSGWLEGYDPRSVKKEAGYIIDELWKEFTVLLKVYRSASEQRKGMLILAGYQGTATEDFENDI